MDCGLYDGSNLKNNPSFFLTLQNFFVSILRKIVENRITLLDPGLLKMAKFLKQIFVWFAGNHALGREASLACANVEGSQGCIHTCCNVLIPSCNWRLLGLWSTGTIFFSLSKSFTYNSFLCYTLNVF